MVQVVKRPLGESPRTHKLSFRHLEAMVVEIEQIVNSRPISVVYTDPDGPRALSPAQLMCGYTEQPNLPETKQIKGDAEAAKSMIFSEGWKQQQAVLRGFWKQYRREYLQHLRSLQYVNPLESRPLRIGQVCILQSHEPSRACWPLCRDYVMTCCLLVIRKG